MLNPRTFAVLVGGALATFVLFYLVFPVFMRYAANPIVFLTLLAALAWWLRKQEQGARRQPQGKKAEKALEFCAPMENTEDFLLCCQKQVADNAPEILPEVQTLTKTLKSSLHYLSHNPSAERTDYELKQILLEHYPVILKEYLKLDPDLRQKVPLDDEKSALQHVRAELEFINEVAADYLEQAHKHRSLELQKHERFLKEKYKYLEKGRDKS